MEVVEFSAVASLAYLLYNAFNLVKTAVFCQGDSTEKCCS